MYKIHAYQNIHALENTVYTIIDNFLSWIFYRGHFKT